MPLRVSSVAGQSEGRGIEVGMALASVEGEAVGERSFEAAVELLAASIRAGKRPLTLTFRRCKREPTPPPPPLASPSVVQS